MCFNHLWLVAPPFFSKNIKTGRDAILAVLMIYNLILYLLIHLKGGKKKCPCFCVGGRLRWSLDGLPAAKTTPAPSSE